MSELEKILNKEIDRIVKDVMVDEDGEFKGSFILSKPLGNKNKLMEAKYECGSISKKSRRDRLCFE